MTEKEFTQELKTILDNSWEQVNNLVERAREQEGKLNNTEPISWYYEFEYNGERKADGFVELGGFICDKLQGMNRLNKKSLTRKLRKVLGYNQ